MGLSASGAELATLQDLVAAAQADARNDSPAMTEVVARLQCLAQRVVQPLTRRVDLHDDLVQAALLAVIQAVRNHDLGRPGFLTFARIHMQGAAQRELQKWTDSVPLSSSEQRVWFAACAVAAPAPPVGARCWGHGRAAQVVMTLPAAQLHLLTQRYIEDAPLKRIALAAGTSVPAVSQRLRTAHRAVCTRLAA